MNQLIDPRPMEPAWVGETEPSGSIEWTINRRKWNKETRKYQTLTETCQGTALDFMRQVGDVTLSADPECWFDVDASQASIPSTTPPVWYQVEHCQGQHLYWAVDYKSQKYTDSTKEEGTDIYELMSWIAYMMEEGNSFTLEIEWVDPTP